MSSWRDGPIEIGIGRHSKARRDFLAREEELEKNEEGEGSKTNKPTKFLGTRILKAVIGGMVGKDPIPEYRKRQEELAREKAVQDAHVLKNEEARAALDNMPPVGTKGLDSNGNVKYVIEDRYGRRWHYTHISSDEYYETGEYAPKPPNPDIEYRDDGHHGAGRYNRNTGDWVGPGRS